MASPRPGYGHRAGDGMGKAFPSGSGTDERPPFAGAILLLDRLEGPIGEERSASPSLPNAVPVGKVPPPRKLPAIGGKFAGSFSIFCMLTAAFSRLPKVFLASFLRPAMMSGVVLTAALNAGGAFALDFNFTFSGTGIPTDPSTVTGLISGLVDNMNNQTSGLSVTITTATNTPTGGWPTFSTYVSGDGFDVSAGAITGVNIEFSDGDNLLYLGNQGFFTTDLYTYTSGFVVNTDDADSLSFTPYTPSTAVPGPLPLLGAACAFRASRQLRRRFKATA